MNSTSLMALDKFLQEYSDGHTLEDDYLVYSLYSVHTDGEDFNIFLGDDVRVRCLGREPVECTKFSQVVKLFQEWADIEDAK